MKLLLLAIAYFSIANVTTAQQKTGIITFATPANWTMTSNTTSVTLEKQRFKKNENTCKVELLQTENKIVNTEKLFLAQVTAKQTAAEKYDANTVKRTEANGSICYGIKGTITNNLTITTCYFYSITNGEQTILISYIKGEEGCTTGFQQFWTSILVDSSSKPQQINLKSRTKKAPPGSPAAPAPMM